MTLEPISTTLHELLVRQGLTTNGAGTLFADGMKSAGRSFDSAAPQVAAGEEVTADLNSGKRTGTASAPASVQETQPSLAKGKPVLRVVKSPIDCKDGRTHAPRVAPLGVRPSFQLIIGGRK